MVFYDLMENSTLGFSIEQWFNQKLFTRSSELEKNRIRTSTFCRNSVFYMCAHFVRWSVNLNFDTPKQCRPGIAFNRTIHTLSTSRLCTDVIFWTVKMAEQLIIPIRFSFWATIARIHARICCVSRLVCAFTAYVRIWMDYNNEWELSNINDMHGIHYVNTRAHTHAHPQ